MLPKLYHIPALRQGLNEENRQDLLLISTDNSVALTPKDIAYDNAEIQMKNLLGKLVQDMDQQLIPVSPTTSIN